MPSSMTRFVDANMNATALTKCAPFATRERAAARAAKEQDEDAAPKRVDSPMLCASGAPTYFVSRALGTND